MARNMLCAWLSLLSVIGWSTALGWSEDFVLVSRSWLTVDELVQAAEDQSGVRHQLRVEDTLDKMVLYDHLTTAESIREAVSEYFTFVLHQRVVWQRQNDEWWLRPTTGIITVPLDLAKWEEEMSIPVLGLDGELPPWHDSGLPELSVMGLSTGEDEKNHDVSSTQTTGMMDDALGEDGDLKSQPFSERLSDVPQQWWHEILGLLNHFWIRSGDVERTNLRRWWYEYGHVGQVPLAALVLSGSLDFKMSPSREETETLLKKYENIDVLEAWMDAPDVMPDLDVIGGSPQPILVQGELLGMGTGPIGEHASQVNAGMEAERLQGDIFSGAGSVPQETTSKSSNSEKLKRWVHWEMPKHILSFSPKSWWQRMRESRVDHPEEKPVKQPSRRALQRRDQARRVFDEARDWLEAKREVQTTRRER